MIDVKGSLEIKVLGTPVYLHWSLVFLIVPIFLSGTIFLKLLSLILNIIVIIVHEFGHVFFVKIFRYDVIGVVVHAFGGLCFHKDVYYDHENRLIAFGGVLFQFILLLISTSFLYFLSKLGVFPILIDYLVWNELVKWNLTMIFLNLLPIPGLDGHEIYKIEDIREKLAERKRIRQIRKKERLKKVQRMKAKSVAESIVVKARKSSNKKN